MKGTFNKLNAHIELSIRDINGKLIESINDNVNSNPYEKIWDFKTSLSKGIYVLNTKVEGENFYKKLIVK